MIGLGFWDFLRRKKSGEMEVANTRIINDIQIHVATGLHGTRNVKISGWNEPMTEALFWKVWDGLEKREKDG